MVEATSKFQLLYGVPPLIIPRDSSLSPECLEFDERMILLLDTFSTRDKRVPLQNVLKRSIQEYKIKFSVKTILC